jgi:hypothetical protein
MSDKQWLQKYVFTDLNEIFLEKFPVILIEWLEILVEKARRFNTIVPRNWTLELVRQLNFVSNPTTRQIHFYLDSVLGGYVAEFVIDFIQTYSVLERDFFKGPCRRFLKPLNTWIKMLLCENHVMVMQFDC